jgi:predicted HAD superfamily Cof-like phosphohydrolase
MILNLLDKVYTFQETFGQLQSERVSTLLKKDRQLRFNLQLEEYLEFKKAERENDHLEMLDGLIDGTYVCCGSILAHGFKSIDSFFVEENVVETDIVGLIDKGKNLYVPGHLPVREIVGYYTDLLFWHIRKIKELENESIFVQDCLFPAFMEVHNSNMSKLGENGKPIYREDGKVLKGKNFVEPNLSKFICLSYCN